jgi:radical SAM protein with 4Fe4S-binding SPASM domain
MRELAVAPSGRLYPCARLVGEDRGGRLVIGDVWRGPDEGAMAGVERGPADPACGECAERWRCGGRCACANLAETGTTHLPGGVQCWYEQTSARIADELGHRLLGREPCEAFVDWTYGRVARARRLPVLHRGD